MHLTVPRLTSASPTCPPARPLPSSPESLSAPPPPTQPPLATWTSNGASGATQTTVPNTFTLLDNFLWTKGKHSLTIGFTTQWLEDNVAPQIGPSSIYQLSFSANSTAAIVAGTVSPNAAVNANSPGPSGFSYASIPAGRPPASPTSACRRCLKPAAVTTTPLLTPKTSGRSPQTSRSTSVCAGTTSRPSMKCSGSLELPQPKPHERHHRQSGRTPVCRQLRRRRRKLRVPHSRADLLEELGSARRPRLLRHAQRQSFVPAMAWSTPSAAALVAAAAPATAPARLASIPPPRRPPKSHPPHPALPGPRTT